MMKPEEEKESVRLLSGRRRKIRLPKFWKSNDKDADKEKSNRGNDKKSQSRKIKSPVKIRLPKIKKIKKKEKRRNDDDTTPTRVVTPAHSGDGTVNDECGSIIDIVNDETANFTHENIDIEVSSRATTHTPYSQPQPQHLPIRKSQSQPFDCYPIPSSRNVAASSSVGNLVKCMICPRADAETACNNDASSRYDTISDSLSYIDSKDGSEYVSTVRGTDESLYGSVELVLVKQQPPSDQDPPNLAVPPPERGDSTHFEEQLSSPSEHNEKRPMADRAKSSLRRLREKSSSIINIAKNHKSAKSNKPEEEVSPTKEDISPSSGVESSPANKNHRRSTSIQNLKKVCKKNMNKILIRPTPSKTNFKSKAFSSEEEESSIISENSLRADENCSNSSGKMLAKSLKELDVFHKKDDSESTVASSVVASLEQKKFHENNVNNNTLHDCANGSKWRSVYDKFTSKVYYYHTYTRETTWNKPADFQPATEQLQPEASSSSLSVESAHSTMFEPAVWAKKMEIVSMLSIMSPDEGETNDQLMDQYDGKEDELLIQLKGLVEQTPFDEPSVNLSFSDATINTTASLDGSSAYTTSVTNEGEIVLISNGNEWTANDGVNESRISNKTPKVSNQKKIIDEAVFSVYSSNTMQSTPTSVKDPYPSMDEDEEEEEEEEPFLPRQRSLNLEEFSGTKYGLKPTMYDSPEKKYSSTAQARAMKKSRYSRNNLTKAQHYSPQNIDDSTVGEQWEEGTVEYDDAVSEISSSIYFSRVDIASLVSKSSSDDDEHDYDDDKRSELDSAVKSRDWDRAAEMAVKLKHKKEKEYNVYGGALEQHDIEVSALSTVNIISSTENPTTNNQAVVKPKQQPQTTTTSSSSEWTQTEVDKVISQNDWNSLITYIADMRLKSSDSTAKTNSIAKIKSMTNSKLPRKTLGARSKLQHAKIRQKYHEPSDYEGTVSSRILNLSDMDSADGSSGGGSLAMSSPSAHATFKFKDRKTLGTQRMEV